MCSQNSEKNCESGRSTTSSLGSHAMQYHREPRHVHKRRPGSWYVRTAAPTVNVIGAPLEPTDRMGEAGTNR